MKQSSRTLIPDPYGNLPVRDRHAVMIYISPEAFEFLNKKVFGGTPGALNATATTLLSALIEEIKKLNPAIEHWEPDNEQRILAILKRVSFADGRKAVAKRPASRRANPPASVAPPQPADSANVPSTAD